jgi:RNA polymerase sigma factor (sigma-70 family)
MGIMARETDTPSRYPPGKTSERHPRFDEYFELHRKLIFWWARRLGKKLGIPYAEFVGLLTIRFNRALYYYDEKRSKFSTYFQQDIRVFLKQIKEDSDILTSKGKCRYISSGQGLYFRKPEKKHDFIDELLDKYGNNFWRHIRQVLKDKRKFVIVYRHCHGENLKQIGDSLGLSKERIRQILGKALEILSKEIVYEES